MKNLTPRPCLGNSTDKPVSLRILQKAILATLTPAVQPSAVLAAKLGLDSLHPCFRDAVGRLAVAKLAVVSEDGVRLA